MSSSGINLYSKQLNQASKFNLPAADGGKMIIPFDVAAAVTSLPVYSASDGQAGVLEHLVNFLEDGGYYWTVRACPSTQQQGGSNTILANQSFEDQISVPAGSFLTMIGGISTQSAGFRFQIFDAGAQAYITDGFVNAQCLSGNYSQLPQTGTGMLTSVTGNKNLFILPSPLAIASPGQLNVQIVNLASVTATIEMCFVFAAPMQGYSTVSAAFEGNAVSR